MEFQAEVLARDQSVPLTSIIISLVLFSFSASVNEPLQVNVGVPVWSDIAFAQCEQCLTK